ncbi:4-hydroxy-3-methylbut-2-enyl diphosphate reductase [Candidatus Omnitrophota bacterium]
MKVEVAEHSGFCFGVKNTIKKIEDTLSSNHGNVYSIGLPVHNSQLTDKLKEHGLIIVSTVDEIEDGCIIVRAHGLPPDDMQKLSEKGIQIIDATCPFVRKAQNIAHELTQEGYTVILCGEENHPEVKAIAGFLQGDYYICTSVNDLAEIELKGKVAVLSQTTQSPVVFHAIATELTNYNIQELRIFNTLCESVERRKAFTIDIARRVDVMFVVGGKMSSNTKRLFEVASSHNKNTYHIETSEEIKEDWLKGNTTVGISAGASTPDWIIQEVVDYCTTH